MNIRVNQFASEDQIFTGIDLRHLARMAELHFDHLRAYCNKHEEFGDGDEA